MQVQSLDWEDPLEAGTANHSSILAGESHGQRSLAGYSPQVVESDVTEVTWHARKLGKESLWHMTFTS